MSSASSPATARAPSMVLPCRLATPPERSDRRPRMPAYILVMRDEPVRDADALKVYQTINRDAPRDPNLKPLDVYGRLEALDGEAPDGTVLLEFPTAEAARAGLA